MTASASLWRSSISAGSLWTCGTLGKVHGLRGELYVNPAPGGTEYLELGEAFFVIPPGDAGADLTPCGVTRVGGTDQRPLVRVSLAETREEAIALQGWELVASGGKLDALPHYTLGELMSRPVETISGKELGVVVDIVQAPAHEIVEIQTPTGDTLLVPLVDALVSLDAERDVVLVADGLVDENANT